MEDSCGPRKRIDTTRHTLWMVHVVLTAKRKIPNKSGNNMPPVEAIDDVLAAEAEELDGYFSDAPVRSKWCLLW